MRTEKMAKMVQNAAILAKIQVQYKSDQGELYYGLDILPKKYNYGRFCACAMAIKLGKKSRSENMVHLRQVHVQQRIVMYNFANKVVECIEVG